MQYINFLLHSTVEFTSLAKRGSPGERFVLNKTVCKILKKCVCLRACKLGSKTLHENGKGLV